MSPTTLRKQIDNTQSSAFLNGLAKYRWNQVNVLDLCCFLIKSPHELTVPYPVIDEREEWPYMTWVDDGENMVMSALFNLDNNAADSEAYWLEALGHQCAQQINDNYQLSWNTVVFANLPVITHQKSPLHNGRVVWVRWYIRFAEVQFPLAR